MTSQDLMGLADLYRREVRLDLAVPASPTDLWGTLTRPAETTSWLGRLDGPPLNEGVEFNLWHEVTVRSVHVVQRWLPSHLLELTWDFR